MHVFPFQTWPSGQSHEQSSSSLRGGRHVAKFLQRHSLLFGSRPPYSQLQRQSCSVSWHGRPSQSSTHLHGIARLLSLRSVRGRAHPAAST